ncbi:MAG TPA: hypothetical protein VJP78_05450 [Thermoleophilia bacterium]|nr:hypothetical protein [Thermoleophilia bacterium]
MIVVTGGTGHLGNTLLRCLAAEGTPGVRALVRAGRATGPVADLDLEVRPFHETTRDALDWFGQRGMLDDAR